MEKDREEIKVLGVSSQDGQKSPEEQGEKISNRGRRHHYTRGCVQVTQVTAGCLL